MSGVKWTPVAGAGAFGLEAPRGGIDQAFPHTWYSEPFSCELTDEELRWVRRAERALARDLYGEDDGRW